ncbi:hypothetical protein [Pseudooceanicola sp. LIPI14-2-Ac024]|uniref:hypothetical protein n=1 Tax=Pseudooceanicola sp. LIPI14-2-Ac024 TaxID=3344875 RepID=UPI0035D05FC3
MNWFRLFQTPRALPAPGDPFAHPEIAAMSHRDLADLPLTPPPAPPRRAVEMAGARPATDPIRAAAC